MLKFNRTKIVATVGPASNNKETLIALVKAGVDVFRLNFSHGTHDGHADVIKLIQEINAELNTHVGILADLQGPKIRLGEVENGEVFIEDGQTLTLTTNEMVSTSQELYLTYEDFARDAKVGDRVLIDDGKIELKVLNTNGEDKVTAKVIYGGPIKPKKGVNLPDTSISIPSITPKDIRDLEFILTQPVNWIALSFVRTADEITQLQGIIKFGKHPAKIISKIEKPEALQNIDSIIEVSDAVMVARGDLGVEIPLEQVPIAQKSIVKKCNEAAKPVIIATQILESMIFNPTPTRAETADAANAIFDGADAIMLSGETASGKYPVRAIEVFGKIIEEVEKQDVIYNRGHLPSKKSKFYYTDVICYNACIISEQTNAKAIVGLTHSGYTALLLSSFRPKANIYAFTDNETLINTLSLVWGVRTFFAPVFKNTDKGTIEVRRRLKEAGYVKRGDVVVNTSSMPMNLKGKTNMVKLGKIE
ncbi:MAG: pyruvate kinase [Chitinophagales bacterium]